MDETAPRQWQGESDADFAKRTANERAAAQRDLAAGSGPRTGTPYVDAAGQQRAHNEIAARHDPTGVPVEPQRPNESDAAFAARTQRETLTAQPHAATPLHVEEMAAGVAPGGVAQNPGESDDDYQARVKSTKEADETAKKLAAEQEKAAKDGTTAHPSGLQAAAAFGVRVADAMFRLRNHGYDEVTSLIDDLYAGVQRVEATARGDKPAGEAQRQGESDADYAARTGDARRAFSGNRPGTGGPAIDQRGFADRAPGEPEGTRHDRLAAQPEARRNETSPA